MAPSERVECGYYGITKEECLNKACCWDETVTMPGARWCFKQPSKLSSQSKSPRYTFFHAVQSHIFGA